LGLESEHWADYSGFLYGFAEVYHRLDQTCARFPFFGYGADWLSFGHRASAAFFVRPLFHPPDSDRA